MTLLIGFDLTLYPSYYEPWGYTPLESLMFRVPTVTTNLAGFGMWVDSYFENPGNGCLVLNRTDHNEKEVIAGMEEFISRVHRL
jgi:glycogen phosphorylase/synthase